MESKELFACLLLTLVSSVHCSAHCSGEDLIVCDPGGQSNCVCFLTGNSSDPSFFRACSAVTEVPYASYNVREIQPGSFQHADHIITLDLSSNAPPELILHCLSFVGLTSLTELNLQGNELSALPDGLFSPMPALETLNLAHNNLAELNTTEAFRNLSSLQTLFLDHNKLTEFPPDLLESLPALTNISLSFNLWNCSSDSVATLVALVQSGVVVNGDQLLCANSTLVADIVIEGPSPSSSPVQPSTALTPTPTLAPTSTIISTSLAQTSTIISTSLAPTSTIISTSLAPTSTIISTSYSIPITPTPSTPAPVPESCVAVENAGSLYGFFDWPKTSVGRTIVLECPNGPEGGMASRECGEGGEWDEVEGMECNNASETALILSNISERVLSPSNIESVASDLSSALSPSSSPPTPLSLDEVEVVLDITEQLLSFTGASIMVLNNSLQAVDSLLAYSGGSLVEGGSNITDRLRMLIDTALLSALSINQSNLVLMFPHLAVGGVYISGTNHTHILAVIDSEITIVEGEGGGGGDVEVEIDGELEGPVQVTVYSDTSLFNSSSCGTQNGVQGDNDLAPVISVSDKPTTTTQETVTLTYHGVTVSQGEDVVCVQWNGSLNCGRGGWQSAGCRLDRWLGTDFICVCTGSGTFTIIETQSSVESSSGIGHVVEYVFYGCCGLAAILYLPVIVIIIFNRSLRALPLKQCVANMALSQALSFLVMAASYHPYSPWQLCYSLTVLLHYTVLVALFWLAIYPVMAVLKVFRRTWFEHPWLLAPVAAVSWVVPAVVIGAIAASRFRGFPDNPDSCWAEADVFPNYSTFLSGFLMVLTLILSVLAIIAMCCSDYDLELPVHLRVGSAQINAFLYSIAVVCHFITGDSVTHSDRYQLDTDYLLLTVAILAIFCATYFLVANGVGNSRIRSALLCHEDPALKRKVAHYQNAANSPSSLASSSRSSEHRNMRRSGIHLHDEMNLNYVNSYLGYDEVSSYVSLDMLGHVDQSRQGRRVKDKRNGERSTPKGGASGFRNGERSTPKGGASGFRNGERSTPMGGASGFRNGEWSTPMGGASGFRNGEQSTPKGGASGFRNGERNTPMGGASGDHNGERSTPTGGPSGFRKVGLRVPHATSMV